MKHLFLDSNIWLSLYSFSNDDLEQFEKLEQLIGIGIQIIITKQVRDEVIRNRENKIKEALKDFDIRALSFPGFSKGYSEYEEIKKEYSNLKNRFYLWKKRISNDIADRKLPADKVIDRFFKKIEIVECDKYVEAAKLRFDLGNPPGKKGSYGDAINWECLLDCVDSDDLYLISTDIDYRSSLNDDRLNPFLENEWKTKKNTSIHFYKELAFFLKENFEDIKLKEEEDRIKNIDLLIGSVSFVNTHGVIAMLNKHTNWPEDDIERACSAAVNNKQVEWIFTDPDVISFYRRLIDRVDIEKIDNDSYTYKVWEKIKSFDNPDSLPFII